MELRLIDLQLDLFKGAQHQQIVMKPDGDTLIVGDNRSGKTTLFDAYAYAWTGKDSLGRKEFGIKTKVNGEVLHHCDHAVTARFEADGEPLEVKRVYNETWGRPSGCEEDVLTGHETHYFINGLEKKTKREFDAELAAYVGEEDFRLLSDVTYFFNLTPEDQKRLLFSLVRPVTNDDVMAYEPRLGELTELAGELSDILSGKTIETYLKEVKEQRNTLKKDLDGIPDKIATKQEDMPEREDWEQVERERESAIRDRKAIDDELADIAKREKAAQSERVALQKKIGDKRIELTKEQHFLVEEANIERTKALSAIRDLEREKADKQRTIESYTRTITERRKAVERHQKEVDRLGAEMNTLRDQYYKITAEVFVMPQGEAICPTCLRPLEAGELSSKEATLRERFNEDKSRRLNENKTKGAGLKNAQAVENQHIIDYNAEIAELEEGIKILNESVSQIDTDIAHRRETLPDEVTDTPTSDTTKAIEKEIADLEEQFDGMGEEEHTDTTDLKTRKANLDQTISDLDRRLANRDQYNRIQQGIEELQKKQRSINKELAKADKIVDLLETFIKTKDAMIIERINSLFQVVKFSFLSQRLNGKDNITCACTVNGVDYKDVNNAGRINAGLDVINAFCRAKGIHIPIFIDNAESVQEFIHTDSQKVLLYVKHGEEIPAGAILLRSPALK